MNKIIVATLFGSLMIGNNAFAACGDSNSSDKAKTNEFVFESCSTDSDANQKLNNNIDIEYKEGVHYKIVELDQMSQFPTPSVLEYIWIGCPDCVSFAPYFDNLSKEVKELSVKKRHSVKNKLWERDARLYYSLTYLGYQNVIPELMELYINLRKEDKELTDEYIDQFLVNKNIDVNEIRVKMKSNYADKQIAYSKKEMKKIDLKWVPSVIVNNKYMALYNDDIKTNEDYIKLVKYLIKNKK